jgi:hypothetical protein
MKSLLDLFPLEHVRRLVGRRLLQQQVLEIMLKRAYDEGYLQAQRDEKAARDAVQVPNPHGYSSPEADPLHQKGIN